MEESQSKHTKFLSGHFHPLDDEIEIVLPSKFENSSIKEWYEYHDSNIYIPMIDIDGEITICKKAYCDYCKVWINSKFKAYYFEHHISTSNHQDNIKIRAYQKEEESGVQNSMFSMKNLLLHVLLEGKPISTIESPFF